MSKELETIFETVKWLKTPIGDQENIIQLVGLGWWGTEDGSAPTYSGKNYYDTVFCHFPTFIIRIGRYENNTHYTGKENIIFAEVLLEQEATNYDAINSAVNALADLLEQRFPNYKFVRRKFIGNVGWPVPDNI